MTTELNSELLLDVLAQIWQHPETWSQRSWKSDCGTAFCVAGWAVQFNNGWNEQGIRSELGLDIGVAACRLLGLPTNEHHSDSGLFSIFNTLNDVLRLSAELLNIDESVLIDKIRYREVYISKFHGMIDQSS